METFSEILYYIVKEENWEMVGKKLKKIYTLDGYDDN